MTSQFKKAEIRQIRVHLARLLPPGGRPPNAEETVEIAALVAKTDRLIAEHVGGVERGRKILEWRLPQADAPTQNEIRGFAFRNPFILKSIEKRIDRALMEVVERTPGAKAHGRSQRWVRVTRFTTQPKQIDDPSAIDALGGKCAVDALVRCGVLVDDTPALCHRDGHVQKTTAGNVHLLVEVFETAEEEVPDPGPVDAPVEQRKKRTRGPMAQHVVDGGEPAPKPTSRRKGSGVVAAIMNAPVNSTNAAHRSPAKED